MQICSIFLLIFVCIYVCIYHVPYDFITCAGCHINHYSQDTEQFHPDQDPSLPFTPPLTLFPDTPTSSNPVCVGSAAWLYSMFCNPMGCSPPVFSLHEIFQQGYWSGLTFSYSRGPPLMCWLSHSIIFIFQNFIQIEAYSIWHFGSAFFRVISKRFTQFVVHISSPLLVIAKLCSVVRMCQSV